jgi:hypothetical protein
MKIHDFNHQFYNVCSNYCFQSLKQYSTILYSDRIEAIAWCQEYHAPFISSRKYKSKNLPPLYACYGDSPPESLCYLEGKKVHLFLGKKGTLTQVSEELIVIKEEQTNNLYVLTPHGQYAWFPCLDQDSFRQPARIIRERLIGCQMAENALKLHGGVAFIDSQAYLIFGPKGAGKTSTIFQLLRAGTREFCANDRVLVNIVENRIICYGLPISIRIGRDIIDWFPELSFLIADYPNRSKLNFHTPSINGSLEKFEFTPQELAQLLQLSIVTHAQVQGVLIPELVQTQKPIKITDVSLSERQTLIKDSLLIEDPAFPPVFLDQVYSEVSGSIFDRLFELPWYKVSGCFSDERLTEQLKILLH